MTTKKQEKIKFSKAFWVANTVELFERAAYYGVFIVITLYLSRILGFNDIQAASIRKIQCRTAIPHFRVNHRGGILGPEHDAIYHSRM